MHNYCKTIGALAAVSALVAGNASAEVEYELHTGYSNEYLLRGINLGQDLIEVGADVKCEAAGLSLSAGAWYGSFDNAGPTVLDVDTFTDTGRLRLADGDVGELDLYGQVSKDFGFLTGSVGYIYRYFESNEINTMGTQEVFFGVSRQFFGIDTSLNYFWSIESADGSPLYNEGYSELALSKSFELSQCLTLNCGGKLGYLVEEGVLTAFTTKVSLDWGFTPTAKLSPFVAYAIALDDDAKLADYQSKNQFVGGMMLSVGF
ncbi:MAG: hypothetical protein NTW21_20080 [Verrucomicrobia bacterium]|nr:hypothetical protein [Verrucomicrobiota bacterium]